MELEPSPFNLPGVEGVIWRGAAAISSVEGAVAGDADALTLPWPACTKLSPTTSELLSWVRNPEDPCSTHIELLVPLDRQRRADPASPVSNPDHKLEN